jgi:hypothetical protein
MAELLPVGQCHRFHTLSPCPLDFVLPSWSSSCAMVAQMEIGLRDVTPESVSYKRVCGIPGVIAIHRDLVLGGGDCIQLRCVPLEGAQLATC